MDIVLRNEIEKEYKEVEHLTREAFWDVFHPGCTEHYILHNLRNSSDFIHELDFVALDDGKIVGNIVYTKAVIVDSQNNRHEIITFGPLSVLPTYQKKGVGKILLNHTLQIAKNMGYKSIVITGNPTYYPQFGFKNAEKYHITTSDGANFDAFMAMELYPGGLSGISGKFFESKDFSINESEFALFDKQFPYKEKHITDSQLK